ncbi:hypothetical protein Tco_0505759 [Tanacetum coccineum]
MDEDQYCCHRCYCERCGNKHDNGFCSKCNLYVNPNSFNNYDPRVDNPSNDIREQKALDTMQTWCELIIQQKVKEKQEEKNIAEKAANRRTRTPEFLDCFKLTYKKSTIPLNNMPEIPPTDAITPDLPIMDSLIMEDEHLDTIPETESDKVIKSSVENLIPIPSESEDFSDIESECDVPVCDDSSPSFTTFSNPLFDSNDDFTFSDDESLFYKDVPKENFKIYSNPLFDEEIISTKIDPHHFNAESDLIESLLNRDTSIVSSPKIDSLLEEFSGELAHINLIPPGINETDFDPEEEIHLIMKLLYDSSPHPPKELNSEISDATIESSSPSPIPVEDSDSLMEEIDLFLDPDDSIPPGIKNELLSDDSLSLPKNKSFHFDRDYFPSSPRPPAEPPDDGIYFDIVPDTGVFTKVVDDISELHVFMPSILPTQPNPSFSPVIETLLPFSSENEDKVFNPGILSSNLLSHRGKITSDFSEIPMMIYGGDIPISDVPFLHFYPP